MSGNGGEFIPGLELCEHFFQDAVQPILSKNFPDLTVSAGLLGSGSEVLGYDTPQSMDHDWGPRVMLFLEDADFEQYQAAIEGALARELPLEFMGFPIEIAFSRKANPWEPGSDDQAEVDNFQPRVTVDDPKEPRSKNHGVTIHSFRSFFLDRVHMNIQGDISPLDWILTPQQQLLSVTAGKVFADPAGWLGAARARLAYYPRDVWLYLLAAQWMRISQEEHFMGRCGQVGDELGSRLVAARLVKDLMNLCFLMERKYAPYIKWFGTAFQRLPSASQFLPLFEQILTAESWQARQEPLAQAFETSAHLHNELGITAALEERTTWFHERPFKVIWGERFASAIRQQIQDPQVVKLPVYLGGVDQFLDSTDSINYLNQEMDRIKRCLDKDPA